MYDANVFGLTSSSYSSLDWVLSHWVHFTVRSVCMYAAYVVLAYCEHGGVDLMVLKPSS